MEKGNKRGIWRIVNVFDLVLIGIAVLTLAVLVIVRTGGGDDTGPVSTSQKIRYTVEVSGISFGAADNVKPGDEMVDRIKKYDMGTVESVTVEPYMKSVPDFDSGEVVLAEVPDQQTAYIVVVANATVSDTAILVDGGYSVKVGLAVNVKVPGLAGTGHIVAVER